MCFGLNEIESDILSRRLGPTPETLEQIANTYDRTRERIRQLQGQALGSLRRSVAYRNSRKAAALSLKMKGYLTREITSRYVRQGYPNIELNLRVAIGSTIFDDIMRGSSNLYGDAIIRDRQIYLAIEDFQQVVDQAVVDHPICTAERIIEMITTDQGYTPVSDWVKEAVVDLWPILRRNADDKLAELRRNATAANLAYKVVKEAGRPLHWTAVGQEVNSWRERLGLSPLSERGTHNQMQSRKDLFSYAGQGTYGLREWGDDVPYIRELIVKVLEEAGRPLAMNEISDQARRARAVKESSLTFYLTLHPDFYLSRSGKYGLPAWLHPNPTIQTSRDYVQELNDREKRLNSSFTKQR